MGWNPLLALHFGGGGHNDAVMMLLVVGALALAAAGAPNLAGVAWVAAIGLKWVAAAFLVLWAIDRRAGVERARPARRSRREASRSWPCATVRYGTTWLEAFGGLSSQARRTGSIGLSRWLGDLGLGHRAILAAIGLATLAAFAWLALRGLARRAGASGVSGSVAALGQGWLNPWYASWGVSLVGEPRRTGWPGCSPSA